MSGVAPVVRLLTGGGSGPVWGVATEDLNATLLAWPPGAGAPEHVNHERDVVLVVVAGGGSVWLDGVEHAVEAGTAVVIEKGSSRRIEAGGAGLRYLSVHRRRGGLTIARRS